MKPMNRQAARNEQLTMNREQTRCSSFIIHGSFVLVFWLGILSVGFAQQPWPPVYEIKADSGFLNLDTASFQVLEDRAGKYSFEQVQRSSSFQFSPYSNPNRKANKRRSISVPKIHSGSRPSPTSLPSSKRKKTALMRFTKQTGSIRAGRTTSLKGL
jgi:hypothetical protein